MSRPARNRYIADIRLVVTIAADDEDDALARLAAVQDFIWDRLQRSTFERLPGKPKLDAVPDVISDAIPNF